MLLSSLIPSSSGLPGGMTKDPRLLPCFDCTYQMELKFQTTAQYLATSATFWTAIDAVGAFATTSADNTYTTICDLTGAGVLFHVISQEITNTTDDVTFRITVDGIEYVIAKTQTWQVAPSSYGGRVGLGLFSSNAAVFDTSGTWFRGFPSGVDWTQAFTNFGGSGSGATGHPISPETIMRNGWSCVRFEKSLKVEVKVTDVNVASTYGQRCGATYILD